MLAIDSVPDKAPEAFGAKRTETSADCLAAIVKGSAGDTTMKRALLLVIPLMVRGADPLLITASFRSFVWPEGTLPKSTEPAPFRNVLSLNEVHP